MNDADTELMRSTLQEALRNLTRATVLLYVVLALTAFAGWYVNHQLAVETNAALCTFVSDLQARAETTAQFLRDNPAGIAGIPEATLRQSLENQRLTIESLSGLGCLD